jgi:hypothetical protein
MQCFSYTDVSFWFLKLPPSAIRMWWWVYHKERVNTRGAAKSVLRVRNNHDDNCNTITNNKQVTVQARPQMDRMFGLYTGRRAMACLMVAMPVKAIKKMHMVNASTSVRTCQWLCHMLWINITRTTSKIILCTQINLTSSTPITKRKMTVRLD